MGWLIALVVILLLLSVPLGLHGRYDGKTARLQALIGPVRIDLYPRPKKDPDGQTQKEPPAAQTKAPPEPARRDTEPQTTEREARPAETASGTEEQIPEDAAPKRQDASGLDGTGAGEDAMESPQGPAEDAAPQKEAGGWQEYLPLIHTGLDLLRAFRRKLVLRRLECRVVLAGPDPCDLAVNYGRLCAAVAGLMPQIERLFTIRKKDIQIQCDYNATQTRVFFQADLVISVGKLLLLALVYGIRGLREYWTILNNRKGGAVT